ncbi:MAG: UvrD-helicase domain-containing protein [Planctomycetota bacterium]
MSGLNPAQYEAVNNLRGPMLVLAGAGSGKTRVITFRIAKLIQSGIAADRILGVTFTNKAANEMQERLAALTGKKKKKQKRPAISTFHSLCVRILREHIARLGYPEKFAIYNRGDQEALAREVLREINVADSLLAPAQLLFHISNWKNRSINPEGAILDSDTDRAHLAAIGYDRYQSMLKNRGCVDFDDLLILTETLFKKFEDCRTEEASKFDHILVDEYQDTNGSQYRIIRALAQEHQNLCVVGDDDQSIYGWRGAEVQHILNFKRDWPDAREIRLEDNYRSTGAILDFANTLIQFNSTRHDKILKAARGQGLTPQIHQFPNEAKEASETVYSIKKRLQERGVEPRDFAILFRTNEQPRPFETELRKNRLPYVLIGGMSFFDRKEIKDILAYLRLLDGQGDEVSILRIINTPPRGIGKKSIESLLDHAISNKLKLWDVITGKQSRPKLANNALRGISQLQRIIEDYGQQRSGSLVERARDLIQAINYRGELDRVYTDPNERESRWNSVEQVVNALAEYETSKPKGSLTDFLDRVLLGDQDMDDEKDKQLQKNAIALMTVHSSKGLEFPEVYIVGMEEGIMPHHRSLEDDEAGVEEERRLCYVAVTRAQERLTMSMSLTRLKWGKPRDSLPSRFLYELIGQAEHPNHPKNRRQRTKRSPAKS